MTHRYVENTPVVSTPPSGRRAQFYRTLHRISDRMTPDVAVAFESAVLRLQALIDLANLRSAVAGGNLSLIEAAAGSGRIQAILENDPALVNALLRTVHGTGQGSVDVLSQTVGFSGPFNARNPAVVLAARRQVANLVVQVGADVKEAIRIVVALGSSEGLTVVTQAQAIRAVVGLPPNWAGAPGRFASELRRGIVNPRRLFRSPLPGQTPPSVAYVRELKRGIATGKHLDAAWVSQQEARYAKQLLKRRSLNIARTETIRAGVLGQQQSWRDAIAQGFLPRGVKRVWIVTPDDRLRATHAAVPGMNPNGVGLEEPFQTPLGPAEGPPLEPNCRCGVGLAFPQLG